MPFSVTNRDNITMQTRWEEESYESDFFDVRYKGKKWPKDSFGQDKTLTEEFKKWLTELMLSDVFDWAHFASENGMDDMLYFIKAKTDYNFKLEEDFLYLTHDNVLGVKLSIRKVRYTYNVNTKKNKYWERYVLLRGTENDGFYFKCHDEKIYLDNYNFEDGIFVKTEP